MSGKNSIYDLATGHHFQKANIGVILFGCKSLGTLLTKTLTVLPKETKASTELAVFKYMSNKSINRTYCI